MQFNRVDVQDANSQPLPRQCEVFQADWHNNLSAPMTLLPDINDDGDGQTVRLETTIADLDFYEFSTDDPAERTNSFPSGQDFSFEIRIRRKPVDVGRPPCRLRTTLFFTITDGGGEKKKRQMSENVFIQ